MAKSHAPSDVRLTALHLIQKWRRKPDVFVSDLIAESRIELRDQGLLRELVTGVIRYQRLYESLSNNLLKKNKNPQDLLDILSIAAHQVFSLDGIPDHAIGQTSVELATKIKKQKWKGVINALTRKFMSMRLDDPNASKPKIKPSNLPKSADQRYSFNPLFIEHLKGDYPEDWESIATALNASPKLCTRWRNEKDEPVSHEQAIRTEWPWMWWERVQDALSGPVEDGYAAVQDRSQGFVMELAGIKDEELVLDLCAAPGGKTLAAIDAGAHVLSADVNPSRAAQIHGLNAGRIFVQDGLVPACIQAFDCVLVDAPCSNSGVFARRPEARWRYKQSQLDELAALQTNLIRAAADLVKPGGRLIYSTCSINRAENQKISHGLNGWKVIQEHVALPNEWQAGAYAARLECVD